jgi:choice-of-anchor A domain-containing protein
MLKILSFPGLAVSAALFAAPAALATPYDTLNSIAGSYNMFLLGNLGTGAAPYTADMQGPVAVAGNAYLNGVGVDTYGQGSAGLVVGGNLSQNGGNDSGNVFVGGNAAISSGGGINNLSVGGNLTSTGGTISGNVFVGGAATNLAGGVTINGSLNLTGANSSLNASGNGGSSPNGIYVTASTQVNDPSYWNAAKVGGGPATPSSPVDLYGSSTDLQNASTALAASGTQTVTSSGGAITITLNSSGLNVINLNLANGATINGINIVNANGVVPTGVVINVNGNNLNFNGGSFNLGSLSTGQVLFNFTTASTVNLSNLAFLGDVLAPLATIDFISGQLQGSLIADNYIGNGQINEGTPFADVLPTYNVPGGTAATPEPGSMLIFGVGLAGICLLRGRLKARFLA